MPANNGLTTKVINTIEFLGGTASVQQVSEISNLPSKRVHACLAFLRQNGRIIISANSPARNQGPQLYELIGHNKAPEAWSFDALNYHFSSGALPSHPIGNISVRHYLL